MSIWSSRIRHPFRTLCLTHTSPREIALALALGVFLGASPLWGLHTLLALSLCYLIGLNKPTAVFGTLISNPLLAPFLVFLSLEAGSWVLYGRAAHLSLHEVRSHFQSPIWQDLIHEYLLPYCVGSLVVGLALALVAFWVSLWIAQSYRSVSQQAGGVPGIM